MRSSTANNQRPGFTLAEIVVVVIVLGVLAAIVVPQFTSAAVAARQDAVKEQLHTIRAAIELYKAQHHDALPDLSDGWTPLTTQTDASGQTTGTPLFGPYLPSPPVNPLTHAGALGTSPAAGVDWLWDSSTGTITALDPSGIPFVETP